MKLPKEVGKCIDLLYLARRDRETLQKRYDDEIKKLKAKEEEIESHIIENFSTQAIGVAGGSFAKATVRLETHAQPEDETSWPKIFGYVGKHEAWDLLYRRINTKSYTERVEAGEKIPGVKLFSKKKLSLTQIKK